MDTHLLLAEALWQEAGPRGTARVLPHYDAAAELARTSGQDSKVKEDAIALGHGFALSQLGMLKAARKKLKQAKALAETNNNAEAAAFVQRILDQVGERETAAGKVKSDIWQHFTGCMTAGKVLVLFLRGPLSSPFDDASQRGVALLKAVGCKKVDHVDICAREDEIMSISASLDLPQLFVAGEEVESWLDLSREELRARLLAAGVPLDDMKTESCHGTFSEGLEAWEVKLVELVSQSGAGNWEEKVAHFQKHDVQVQGLSAKFLNEAWERLAPIVREKLEVQPEMPCGHSCNTCPTRHDCQLHDAVGGLDPKDLDW